MKSLYLVEYYTRCPITGEGGQDIKLAWVNATDNADARLKAATLPLFDCVILCGRQAEMFKLHCPRTVVSVVH